MNEHRRVLLLISIMASISLIIAGVTIFSLYQAAIKEVKERLIETVQSQARLIEVMAGFDDSSSNFYVKEGAWEATLSKITAAHNKYEKSGRTAEFALARHEGDSIFFLIRHRHGGLEHPFYRVSLDSKLAEPMRRALSGKSGTVIGLDYRGKTVLAAYEPLFNLGIVAKVDLSEIRGPFIKAGGMALFFAFVVVAAGSTLFIRITNPMIKTIENHNKELEVTNKKLQEEINERKQVEDKLKRAHNELETRVMERTAELSEANKLLSQEIREREKIEDVLRQSEKRYRLLVNNANDGIAVAQDGHMKFVNPQMVNILGYSELELTSRLFLDFIHPDDHKIALEHHANKIENPNVPEAYTLKIIDKSGKVKWIENRGVGIQWEESPATLNFVNDITERKLFERQLIQKEKMASLGVLVSSIAHEINNPNNFISFNIPILRDYINEMMPIIDNYACEHPEFEICRLKFSEFRQDIFKLLENVENGSNRISNFVFNLREFSQDKVNRPLVWVELKDVVEGILSICRSKIKSSVKSFIIDVPEPPLRVRTEWLGCSYLIVKGG